MAFAAILALVFTALCPFLTQGVSAQTLGAPLDHASRRSAAMSRLERRLLIVPARSSFMADDQAGFQQATDFQYLSGWSDLVGAVLVLDGSAKDITLFVPRPNPLITHVVPAATPEGARTIGVDAVHPIDSLEPWLRLRLPRVSGALVAPTDVRGAIQIPPPMASTVLRWQAYLTTLGFTGPVTSSIPLLRPLREIKDSTEIAIIKRVGAMSGQAMLAGLRALRPGRTQRKAQLAVVDVCISAGGMHSFWPWTMSGPHAVFTDLYNYFVDYDGHDRVMQAGELVRVDVGCQYAHYMGDVGRTAPVSGRFTAGQREAWDLFIAGYRAGLVGLRDGTRPGDVFAAALRRVRELQPMLKTPLGRRAAEVMLAPDGTAPWQLHGVGLDDAEGQPEVLKAGMTVAYEVMFAVDGHGFYLEDMILIRPDGYEMLTPDLPYTAAAIESAMRRR